MSYHQIVPEIIFYFQVYYSISPQNVSKFLMNYSDSYTFIIENLNRQKRGFFSIKSKDTMALLINRHALTHYAR